MKIVGALLMIVGIAFGIWAGLWWAFAGGIIDIVVAIQSNPIPAGTVAWGVIKILFAGVIGMVAGVVAVFPGFALFTAR